MIWTLTTMARGLRKTLESMATPCSVNAYGRYLRCDPRPLSKITICDLKDTASCMCSRNMKSAGKRSRLRLTA